LTETTIPHYLDTIPGRFTPKAGEDVDLGQVGLPQPTHQ